MLALRRRFDRLLERPSMMRLASFLKSNPLQGIDQQTWDHEYARGDWDDLGDSIDMYRYPVVAGYVLRMGPAASVLDIGCGSGLLAQWLSAHGQQNYFGIDLSNVAIDKARARRLPAAQFEVADGAAFNPGQKFSAIVFNELLYYVKNPERLLAHYNELLAPDGLFVISLFKSFESLQTWRRCSPHLDIVSETRIRAGRPYEWNVFLCRPRMPSAK
jgi:2-polyprenyl-3-methyl-5-hydroxy-6-metoxy-1,4-benzoquinol methylase